MELKLLPCQCHLGVFKLMVEVQVEVKQITISRIFPRSHIILLAPTMQKLIFIFNLCIACVVIVLNGTCLCLVLTQS